MPAGVRRSADVRATREGQEEVGLVEKYSKYWIIISQKEVGKTERGGIGLKNSANIGLLFFEITLMSNYS